MTDDDRPNVIAEKARAAADAAKRFNSAPPMWFYWVAGLAIIVIFQFVRAL